MMMILRFLKIGICICLLFISVMAQKSNITAQKKKTTDKAVRVKKDKPHIFINFQSEGKIEPLYDGESDMRVWLKLNNNSRWKIKYCSRLFPKEYVKYGEQEVDYEIERMQGFEETPVARNSDTCGYFVLRSGESVLFSVPREHLAKGLAVKIQYRYEWEIDSDGSDNLLEPKHYVYFYSKDVPKK